MSELARGGALRTLLSGWPYLLPAVALALLGVLTMHPFGEVESFAPRQLLWIGVGLIVYAVLAVADMHVLRRTSVIMVAYLGAIGLLLLLLIFADPVKGAKSWFTFGAFSFQPADLAKLALIAFLAKYFSRRHIEIRHVRHLILSGLYAGLLIGLVLIQPDLGTAAILSFVWFGMVLVSGISKKHLAIVFILGVVAAAGLWFFGLHDYQRTRIVAFLNPAADIRGAGYNAYQAVVAAGSGELFGKGIGYGTQSKLRFLPEYETDFIFAAFAEEWGFIGVSLALLLYGLLIFQLLALARRAATNFDALFTVGVALLFLAHVFIHAGINLGLLPVTGTTIPFMSYGGSHLLTEFAALGIVVSLSRHARSAPRTAAGQEYLGA
ncbi:MAG TPA: FtsW/RodA/SpoVE family cell cycle protein [Candidatus Paceibacterota bacterium]|nr:FtsW/RodA/SpoVE family cell cycle protein [Candidatus Paceibacterota bacterium]